MDERGLIMTKVYVVFHGSDYGYDRVIGTSKSMDGAKGIAERRLKTICKENPLNNYMLWDEWVLSMDNYYCPGAYFRIDEHGLED